MTEQEIKILIGIIAFLALFVKVPKVEIPIWKWILEGVGKAINAPLTAQIKSICNEMGEIKKILDDHIKEQAELEISACRRRILRFYDECQRGEKHGQEHWNSIIEDVDVYTSYCHTHPEYSNTKAEKAMKYLKDIYNKLTPQDFL